MEGILAETQCLDWTVYDTLIPFVKIYKINVTKNETH